MSGLKNMKSVGAKVPSSPDEFARQLKENSINVNEICSEINVGMVKYEQWKKVQMPDGKKENKDHRKRDNERRIHICHTDSNC